MNKGPQIFRGTVNGQKKYCRVLIRRRRAPLRQAIEYFADAIQECDEIIPEYSAEEQKELRDQQACFVTAIVALRALDGEVCQADCVHGEGDEMCDTCIRNLNMRDNYKAKNQREEAR